MAKAITKFDNREWRQFTRKILSNLSNKANLLKLAFMTHGFKDIDEHFEKQQGPKGKWRKRKPATQKRYSKINSGAWKTPKFASRASFNPSNKLLQMTGKLRGSILPTNIRSTGRDSIIIFSNSDYSKIHDEGGTFKAFGKYTAKMPKRKFMYSSKNAIRCMQGTIMRTVLSGT
ncbi:MAG: hypothetical protein KAJ48_08025 [Elusimicrobiales bacterium]|nr:hypothetical protein [Elusimicrobiales bacterium]